MSKVYFIGAGPGAKDLITIRGAKIIEEADVLIYAGSLVNKEVLEYNKKNAKVYNSAEMNLEEVLEVERNAVKENKIVARIHTGDPSLYGAIQEQMDALKDENIEFEVIPGVSSFTAAAAAIKREFTLPGITQTVICTRLEGRTEVPEKEKLEDLAKHRASMAIFLSVGMIDEVVKRLTVHYDVKTPVAVVKRATWSDEEIIYCKLENLAEKVKQHKITKTAQILVGDFIHTEYEKSKLYDKKFSHEYRKAE
jgi:precorrin-4/cobalt-precorrin-4 C11-methyltransferase